MASYIWQDIKGTYYYGNGDYYKFSGLISFDDGGGDYRVNQIIYPSTSEKDHFTNYHSVNDTGNNGYYFIDWVGQTNDSVWGGMGGLTYIRIEKYFDSVQQSYYTAEKGTAGGYIVENAHSLNGLGSEEGEIIVNSTKYNFDVKNSITLSDTTNPVISGPQRITPSSSGIPRSTVNIKENNNYVFTYTADETVTWSIPDGLDKNRFYIDSNSGVLQFNVAPDFENLNSYDDGYFQVDIKATDLSGNSTTEWLYIYVDDVVEPEKISELQLTVDNKYSLDQIKDYDGNLHGYLGTGAPTSVKAAYKYQGKLDVNNDGTTEAIFTNKESGRWVTASIDPITGAFDYSQNGQGGTTRVVGIYEDPLVKAGLVEKDSVFDGSRTFINDLKLDNLILKTVGDYDGDGFQEVYWSKVDNTAYLRAVMHADGNIQYANYQNLQQMTDYLTSHGFADTVALIA